MPVVLIGVEYCFILYNQYMLLFPSQKHWWYVLESFIIIICHQTVQFIHNQCPGLGTLNVSHLLLISIQDLLNKFFPLFDNIQAFVAIHVQPLLQLFALVPQLEFEPMLGS